jgi:hypothetical protein
VSEYDLENPDAKALLDMAIADLLRFPRLYPDGTPPEARSGLLAERWHANSSDSVQAGWSNVAGRGLFSKQRFLPGQTLFTAGPSYHGDNVSAMHNRIAHTGCCGTIALGIQAHTEILHGSHSAAFLMSPDIDYLVNHDYAGNCDVVGMICFEWDVELSRMRATGARAEIVALRPVEPGDELFFDYSREQSGEWM